MDLEAAFHQALHEDPGDEASWAALTDWLLESGDPRGELLRLHRWLRQSPNPPGRAEREERLCALLASGVRPSVPTITNSFGMRLALVPAGRFLMGSPAQEPSRREGETLHEVEITRAFYLGVHPVTQAEYRRIVYRNPSSFRAEGRDASVVAGLDTDSFPVDHVSWSHAADFCKRLSDRHAERRAGRHYRLPTEAEWEYACRAAGASTTPFHCGQTLSPAQANFDSRPDLHAEGVFLRRTSAVGSYPPNALGLYDLHGNVWEWCADYYDAYPEGPQVDPQGPSAGDRLVVRGGSWREKDRECRAARRDFWYGTTWNTNYIGFRVACDLEA